MSLKAIANWVVKMIFRMSVFFMTIFLIYLAWYWWDMRQLRTFCADIRVGMPVSELMQIADQQGINKRWLRGEGVLDEVAGLWNYYVPSTASVGSNVCAIRHNKKAVVSATIKID